MTNFYNGHLAELLVYDRAVPDRELRSLSSELPELEAKKIDTTKCLLVPSSKTSQNYALCLEVELSLVEVLTSNSGPLGSYRPA